MKTYGIGSENDEFIFDGIKLLNSCEEKVLGVIIENKLKFDPHIRSLRKISSTKIRNAKHYIISRPWKEKTCIYCCHIISF